MKVEDEIKSIIREEISENLDTMSIKEGIVVDRTARRISFLFKEFIQWKDMHTAWGPCNVRNLGFGFYDLVGEEHDKQYYIDSLFEEWIKRKNIK